MARPMPRWRYGPCQSVPAARCGQPFALQMVQPGGKTYIGRRNPSHKTRTAWNLYPATCIAASAEHPELQDILSRSP